MNDNFNSHFKIIIVYNDDVLVFSELLEKHFVHFKKFFNLIKEGGITWSALKMKLFQIKIRFLSYEIYQGMIKLIKK